MPYKGKNHEDFRKTVFFLCLQKCKRELSTFIIERVHKLVKNGLDFNNKKVSRRFSDNCRKMLEKLHQGDTKVLLICLILIQFI